MLIGCAFLGAHPYWGIAHDAKLYLAQALQRSRGLDLSNDLFFLFGSQDSFTLYTALLGPLVLAVGPSAAAVVATVLGAAVFVAAAYALVRALATPSQALFATLVLAALPGYYAALGVPLVEPYATPRTLACGLALLGMHATVNGRAIAVLPFATSLALHPLMALPAVAWASLLRFSPLQCGTAALGGGVILVGLAFAGIAPFDRALMTIDPAWRSVLEDRSPYLFLLLWEDPAWDGRSGVAAFSVVGAFGIALRLTGVARRTFLAGGGVAFAGLLLTLLGGDFAGNVLVLQIQPWRAGWIAAFLTLAGAGMLLLRVIVARELLDVLVLLGVGAGLLLQSSMSPVPALLSLALHVIARRFPAYARWCVIAAVAVFVQAFVWCVLERPHLAAARSLGFESSSTVPLLLRDPFLCLAFGIAALVFLRVRLLHTPVVVLIVAALSVFLADWTLAARRDAERIDRLANDEELRAALPRGTDLYWEGEVITPWFELGVPSYLSAAQTAGVVFSRATALEAARRARHLAGAGQQNATTERLLREPVPALDVRKAAALCGDPILGAVYLRDLRDPDLGPLAIGANGVPRGTLARCDRLRARP